LNSVFIITTYFDKTKIVVIYTTTKFICVNLYIVTPLYPQYLALYQKRKLQAEDLLSASFYAQDQRARASAPPPRILTPEEVRQLHAEADRKREQKQPQQPQYNTFGKMYFPPEGR